MKGIRIAAGFAAFGAFAGPTLAQRRLSIVQGFRAWDFRVPECLAERAPGS